MMEVGTGPYLQDVDGNRYMDYVAAFGPLILGHRPQGVIDAITRTIQDRGTIFGFGHRLEIEAAEAVVDAVPAWEMVRFANTGSEAVLAALRMARAYTGRTKVLKFEGHYHGWTDDVYYSTIPGLADAGPEDVPIAVPGSEGMPEEFATSLLIRQWNDEEALRQVFSEAGSDLAAVICEPVMTNCSVILPKPGFLELLRELTRASGVVLIFDEVKTGFRVALGGAQELYGVLPDVSVAAKAIAGGFPLAAVGGTKSLFEPVAENRVVHTATYHSNPPAMAACLATLEELRKPQFFAKLNALSERMAAGLTEATRDLGIAAHVSAVGSLQQLVFMETPALNYRDLARNVNPDAYRTFWAAMLERGVLLTPTQYHNYFISAAHTEEVIDLTLAAAREALGDLALSKSPPVGSAKS